MITEEKIVENWERLMSILIDLKERSKTPGRWEKLISFYDEYSDRIATMPASSKTSYHNAFPGGYVDHILRVYDASLQVAKVWKEFLGGKLDFKLEELAMVAINHDLGKFGSFEHELYIDQDSKWHFERGEVYKTNPKNAFMKIQDRSLYLLQSIGVDLTEKEYLGIKLHDGLYEESNKSYYVAFSDDYKLKTDLPYVVHQADLLAARVESKLK